MSHLAEYRSTHTFPIVENFTAYYVMASKYRKYFIMKGEDILMLFQKKVKYVEDISSKEIKKIEVIS